MSLLLKKQNILYNAKFALGGQLLGMHLVAKILVNLAVGCMLGVLAEKIFKKICQHFIPPKFCPICYNYISILLMYSRV